MKSLAKNIVQIKEAIKNKTVYLLLDFDGTFSHIAPTPEQAVIIPEAKDLLHKISKDKKNKIAFISGRGLTSLKKKINKKSITYSGNHGFEFLYPCGKYESELSEDYLNIFNQYKHAIKQSIKHIKGVFFEDKNHTFSIHYRSVELCRESHVIKEIERILRKPSNIKLRIKNGKKVTEATPSLKVDKGTAAKKIIRYFGGIKKDVFCIAAGDDTTDEDFFKVVNKYKNSLSVRVGKHPHSVASHHVSSPEELVKIFEIIFNK